MAVDNGDKHVVVLARKYNSNGRHDDVENGQKPDAVGEILPNKFCTDDLAKDQGSSWVGGNH